MQNLNLSAILDIFLNVWQPSVVVIQGLQYIECYNGGL